MNITHDNELTKWEKMKLLQDEYTKAWFKINIELKKEIKERDESKK